MGQDLQNCHTRERDGFALAPVARGFGMVQGTIVLASILLLCACAPRSRDVELLLVPVIAESSGADSGWIRFPAPARSPLELQVQLRGLIPEADYVLCMNSADAASPTNEQLGRLAIPGWPLGAFFRTGSGAAEGYWDFQRVRTGAVGEYAGSVQLPLPETGYRIKFLVKRLHAEGATSILKSDPVLLQIDGRPPWGSISLAGLALIAGVGCAGVLWHQAREHRRMRSIPSASDAVDSGRSMTVIARARAEGVLVHDPSYAWVEIHGRRKSFRPRQAFVVQILCEEDPDCVGLSQDEIIKEWKSMYGGERTRTIRVRDILRSCDDEPGDFIERIAGPASVYRLNLKAPVGPTH